MGQKSAQALLNDMHEAQQKKGYLDEQDILMLADKHGLPPAQVYETASFYSMLYFEPQPRNVIQVCKNAPCHVSGAPAVIAALEEKTGISMGETTEDGSIALRYVECLGQCQDGPSLVVNGVYYKHVTPDQIDGILSALH